jgi:hypothetical protein
MIDENGRCSVFGGNTLFSRRACPPWNLLQNSESVHGGQARRLNDNGFNHVQ